MNKFHHIAIGIGTAILIIVTEYIFFGTGIARMTGRVDEQSIVLNG